MCIVSLCECGRTCFSQILSCTKASKGVCWIEEKQTVMRQYLRTYRKRNNLGFFRSLSVIQFVLRNESNEDCQFWPSDTVKQINMAYPY